MGVSVENFKLPTKNSKSSTEICSIETILRKKVYDDCASYNVNFSRQPLQTTNEYYIYGYI